MRVTHPRADNSGEHSLPSGLQGRGNGVLASCWGQSCGSRRVEQSLPARGPAGRGRGIDFAPRPLAEPNRGREGTWSGKRIARRGRAQYVLTNFHGCCAMNSHVLPRPPAYYLCNSWKTENDSTSLCRPLCLRWRDHLSRDVRW